MWQNLLLAFMPIGSHKYPDCRRSVSLGGLADKGDRRSRDKSAFQNNEPSFGRNSRYDDA